MAYMRKGGRALLAVVPSTVLVTTVAHEQTTQSPPPPPSSSSSSSSFPSSSERPQYRHHHLSSFTHVSSSFLRSLSSLPSLPSLPSMPPLLLRAPALCDAGVATAEAELPELVKQAEEERRKQSQLKNPGSFEKLIEEGKKLSSVDTFEGFRLEIQKMVTPHFYVAHSFMMGMKLPHVDASALYDFSTHVVLPGNQLLMGRLGHGGSMDGRFHFGLGENTLVKVVAGLQPQPGKDNFQLDAEHHAADASMTIRVSKGPQVYASYLQSITPAFALGGDTLYDFSEGGGVMSVGGKYTGKDWVGVAMLAQYGQICLFQYIKHVNPGRMALVADLVVNPLTMDSQTVLGAEVNMKQSRFLTTIDNGGKIGAVLESRVVQNAVTLLLSAEVDNAKDNYRFGYGFSLNL